MEARQEQEDERRAARGEATYATWSRGVNPDWVDFDRVDEDVSVGYDQFEAGEREARRIMRRKEER